mmetsp:Transcript_16772/g.28440  ORF Transcript_16772/g.28440 Transcript_16772/m.28440 type:complete len:161 (-) Transcript_16772:134-616(-)
MTTSLQRLSIILLLLFSLLPNVSVAQSLTSGEDVGLFVKRHIKDNEVMVFAKSYCPYCKRTRSLLQTMQGTIHFHFHVIDLDRMEKEDGPIVQMELLKQTGQRTVPNVFIQGRHIGGNSDLQELAGNGVLQEELSRIVASRRTTTTTTTTMKEEEEKEDL